MAELKREYVVPLRRKTIVAPKWRRSKKALSVLKEFIKKHMKTDNVVICSELNEKIWENGIKNPPGKVSVVALKTQILGVEKTFVNLAEVGVDEHLKLYSQDLNQGAEEKSEKDETKAEVVDAEVKEKTADAKDEVKEDKSNEDGGSKK